MTNQSDPEESIRRLVVALASCGYNFRVASEPVVIDDETINAYCDSFLHLITTNYTPNSAKDIDVPTKLSTIISANTTESGNIDYDQIGREVVFMGRSRG